MVKKVRIGCGAGFSGDRIEPAVALAKFGDLDYLVFECLAERTIALAQTRELAEPNSGYDPLLEERLRKVLVACDENNTKIITNMGGANPQAAAKKTLEILNELNLPHMKVGVVLGDHILNTLTASDFSILTEPEMIHEIMDKIISANAYLGAPPVIELLKKNADVIITGRTCDTSLFLAPMMYDLGWNMDDWDRVGFAIAVSHLLECAAQVTGGYFADPGYKDVEDLANLGFPVSEVYENGEAIITKLPDPGGEVSLRTVKEQLLYEVHDPRLYITADGISDFTKVRLEKMGKDKVKIYGGGGSVPPDELKVSIGSRNGFLGEAQISYYGEGAQQRAKLATQIIMERVKILNLEFEKLRFDFMGGGQPLQMSNETRLRVIGGAKKKEDAEKLCNEVEALYTNGPAGGGGVTKNVNENIAITSVFVPREKVTIHTKILEGRKSAR